MSKPSIRRPPAYQEYASDVLANEVFSEMSLAERGLWQSMRLHCWVNDTVPCDPSRLARLLRLDKDDVKSAMTPNVMSFFAPLSDNPERLVCPELDDYRAEKERYRAKQSEAGRKGAEAAHAKKGGEQLRPPVGVGSVDDDIPF